VLENSPVCGCQYAKRNSLCGLLLFFLEKTLPEPSVGICSIQFRIAPVENFRFRHIRGCLGVSPSLEGIHIDGERRDDEGVEKIMV
jgi:hypothetical protein